VIDTAILSYNKASNHNNEKNPVKKVHSVSNKLFIVIDETIAKHLQLNDNDSWFEQILTKDGILLRRYPYSSLNKLGEAA
jgi:hypothetical protein